MLVSFSYQAGLLSLRLHALVECKHARGKLPVDAHINLLKRRQVLVNEMMTIITDVS